MTTHSANPRLLENYASDLSARLGRCSGPLHRASASVRSFNAAAPNHTVSLGGLATCDLNLRDLEALAVDVRRVAIAFHRADPGTLSARTVSVDALDFSKIFYGAPGATGRLAEPLLGLLGTLRPRSDEDREIYRTDGHIGHGSLIELDASGALRFGPRFEHEHGVTFENGALVARAEAEYFIGLEAETILDGRIGPVDVSARARVQAGAGASAWGSASAGLDGVQAEAGASAFAGVRAEGESSFEAGPVTGTGSVHGTVGIEATARARAEATMDRVAIDVSFGLAAGLGGGGDLKVEVDPKETIETLWDVSKKPLAGAGGGIFKTMAISPVSSATSTISDLLSW